MGAPVSELLAALSWSGRDTMLSLFVAFRRDHPAHMPPPDGGSRPDTVRTYELEDLDRRLPGLSVVEYDLTFNAPPPDLELVIRGWLQVAIAGGASLAWFAFEGSFDFEHLLTPDIADQVYAVATPKGEELALVDEQREGSDWVTSLAAARVNLGL